MLNISYNACFFSPLSSFIHLKIKTALALTCAQKQKQKKKKKSIKNKFT